jgi:glycosyltransferase involved in cell wall biosynthesis
LPRIDQFVPSFARHDAIGNHVRQLRRLLLGAGYQSDIWFEHIDPRLAGEARPFRECDPRPDPDRLILYHGSTHSDMTGWLVDAASAGQTVLVDYHNITPAEYFAAWEPPAARSMRLGREQLARLGPHVAGGLADSWYNAGELAGFGVESPVACPILLDLDEYHQAPDAQAVARLARPGPFWLFVGRVAPNKCQHDVIAAFATYRRLYEPGSRLAIVGSVTSGRYQRALERLATDLSVADAVEFAGPAPFPELLAYFGRADVFVCLSEHEGFCVPVVEAMELGVPVVAYASSAVTETVADAGVLLDGKDPLEVARAVDALLSDDGRRRAAVEAGRARASSFSLPVTSQRWLEELGRIWAAPAGRP